MELKSSAEDKIISNRVWWVPHCTIASRLNEENMTRAFDYCSKKLKRIDTRIELLELLEFQEFNEEGTCISAPAIFTKTLV